MTQIFAEIAVSHGDHSGSLVELGVRETVDRLEMAGIDGLVLALTAGAGPTTDTIGWGAAVAAVSTTLISVVQVSVEGVRTYPLARRLATLDNISSGRSGWQPVVVDGSSSSERLEARDEVVQAMTMLWTSWPSEAVVHDRARGMYVDTAVIRTERFVGRYVDVAGPLDFPARFGGPRRFDRDEGLAPDVVVSQGLHDRPRTDGVSCLHRVVVDDSTEQTDVVVSEIVAGGCGVIMAGGGPDAAGAVVSESIRLRKRGVL